MCQWRQRNQTGQIARAHDCVHKFTGVSVSGEKGLKELIEEGKPVEIVEGDGYNNIEIRVKRNINLTLQKHFDENYVKNIFIMKNSDCQPRRSSAKIDHENHVYIVYIIISLMLLITIH
ncbi:hypothetical protein DPMN_021932 [Dreissena polymorpha]|uniref:Uncharacterized protein n=1 Tax=Dreissena polymorpha TaxID=45954 RepID=A0A9D4SC51_DREPO|nr:hypothetical protein DPMN_021932 [Dreissena polymorpha]